MKTHQLSVKNPKPAQFDSSFPANQLTFADLFAGIGGVRIGFEQAGYKCVYSCEINEQCRQVYFNNFGEMPELDITKIDGNSLPIFDILTAGFPCQPFSICGKRKGFEDTRGTLFFHICEVIVAKQPRVVLLENVKYLLHHNQGETLAVILDSLRELEYFVQYQLLNAKDFGLPQNRERIIIIATKYKAFNFTKIKNFYPIPKLRDYLCKDGNFEYLKPEEYELIEGAKVQESGLIFVGYRTNKSIWKKGVRPNTNHLSRVHRQPNRIYSVDGVHPTLPSQETSGRFFIYLPEENTVRKLTIQECYRIMGFPDNFKIHNSLAECYKQVGNSVAIPMIYELARQIYLQIFREEKVHKKNNVDIPKPPSNLLQLEIPGLVL